MEGVAGAQEAPRSGAAEGKEGMPHEGAAGGTLETLREGAATHPHSDVVERAVGEAGKILGTLRKQNRKKGRAMGRSMGALDEILHGKLKLLHIPRSA